jgi:hypothetical protein
MSDGDKKQLMAAADALKTPSDRVADARAFQAGS